MEDISAVWLYPIILVVGALQGWGPPMNEALRNALTNPRLSDHFGLFEINEPAFHLASGWSHTRGGRHRTRREILSETFAGWGGRDRTSE
jgi:hypothetical protein